MYEQIGFRSFVLEVSNQWLQAAAQKYWEVLLEDIRGLDLDACWQGRLDIRYDTP